MIRTTLTTILALLLTLSLQTLALPTTTTCQQYSFIANFSVISSNNSYRAAYIEGSPDGTFKTADFLNSAQAKLPALTKDVALNQECGNLTTIAITEAANNFTKGIVAQFTFTSSPTSIFAGWELIPLCLGVMFIMFMVWGYA